MFQLEIDSPKILSGKNFPVQKVHFLLSEHRCKETDFPAWLLGNAFAAGSLVCKLQWQPEIELWAVGPKAKGSELVLTLCIAKATGTSGPARWPGTQRLSRGQGAQTLLHLDRKGKKVQGFLCSRTPSLEAPSSSCYFVTAPWLNYFRDQKIWGNLVSSS